MDGSVVDGLVPLILEREHRIGIVPDNALGEGELPILGLVVQPELVVAQEVVILIEGFAAGTRKLGQPHEFLFTFLKKLQLTTAIPSLGVEIDLLPLIDEVLNTSLVSTQQSGVTLVTTVQTEEMGERSNDSVGLAIQDLDGLFHGGLGDVDFLEAP